MGLRPIHNIVNNEEVRIKTLVPNYLKLFLKSVIVFLAIPAVVQKLCAANPNGFMRILKRCRQQVKIFGKSNIRDALANGDGVLKRIHSLDIHGIKHFLTRHQMDIKLVEGQLPVSTIKTVKSGHVNCVLWVKVGIVNIREWQRLSIVRCVSIGLCALGAVFFGKLLGMRVRNEHDFLNHLLALVGMVTVGSNDGLDLELIGQVIEHLIHTRHIVGHNLNVKIVAKNIAQV